jgi:hypothetical protein
MSSTDDDIRWVKAHRPQVDPPGAEATREARAALLAHAERSSWRAVPPVAAARRRPRRRTPLAAVAVAAVAAAVALMPVFGSSGIESAITPGVASAHSLVALATRVAAAARSGDATLVFHRNDAQGERPFTGADLYLDDGRYYYARPPPASRPPCGPAHRTSR